MCRCRKATGQSKSFKYHGGSSTKTQPSNLFRYTVYKMQICTSKGTTTSKNIARYTVTVKSLNAKKVRLWANSYGWTKGQETPLVLRITLWTQGEILMLYNKSKVPLKMMEKLPLHCSVNIYITRRKGHPRWRPNQSTSYVYYLTVYGKNCINSAAIQCINGTHWGRRKNILHHHTSSLLYLTRITSFYIRL